MKQQAAIRLLQVYQVGLSNKCFRPLKPQNQTSPAFSFSKFKSGAFLCNHEHCPLPLPPPPQHHYYSKSRSISFECGFPIWGTRPIYGTHARPSAAPGAAAPGFHFQLEHARVEGKPRRLPSPCRRKKALSTRCHLICWPLLPTCFGGLGIQPNKGRTSPWKMPAGQAGPANISWSASGGRR